MPGPVAPGWSVHEGSAEPALVAFLGGDAGEQLPRDVVVRADLLVDREQLRRDLADRGG